MALTQIYMYVYVYMGIHSAAVETQATVRHPLGSVGEREVGSVKSPPVATFIHH